MRGKGITLIFLPLFALFAALLSTFVFFIPSLTFWLSVWEFIFGLCDASSKRSKLLFLSVLLFSSNVASNWHLKHSNLFLHVCESLSPFVVFNVNLVFIFIQIASPP